MVCVVAITFSSVFSSSPLCCWLIFVKGWFGNTVAAIGEGECIILDGDCTGADIESSVLAAGSGPRMISVRQSKISY